MAVRSLAGRVVIIGAGLAGSLMAIYLARRGHEVEVYERRPDPRLRSSADGRRSINLGLSQRGMNALREVGLLDEVRTRTVPMRGRVIHSADGSLAFQPYGRDDGEALHSILRNDLNVALVERAESHPTVRFHFRHTLRRLVKEKPLVEVVDEERGHARQVMADLVIGADGAFSTVRAQMHHRERADYRQEFLDWGYKELTIPAAADGAARTELFGLHVWPGGRGLMVAHPNVDHSLTCTVFLPLHGPDSFASLDTPAAVRDFFAGHFPDVPALVPDLATEFLAHPVGTLVSIRTSPWHHEDRVVLIGDACHAVYPFYGQGMNAAFEDCTVLDRCLARHPEDRAAALAEYQALRKPHTDVLADLSAQNFVELRDRLRSPWFLVRKRADLVLHRFLPRHWVPLYTMIAHRTVPYAEALRRARRQDRILRWAATLLVVAVCGAALSGAAAALDAVHLP